MHLKDLHAALQAQGVHTLLAQFTDLHGTARGKYVPLAQLASLVEPGAGFAGPSIWGTGLGRTGARSEYYGRADLSTVRALPWQPGVARVVCDGHVDGAPFDACPRQVLRRAVARLAQRGWQLQTGIEPEFFLLRQVDGRWVPADPADRLSKPSYDLKSLPRQHDFLHALHEALSALGMQVLQLDHEDAHGQFEVNFAHADALTSADHLMGFKLAAHALAEARGMVFSMMPKPFADQPGSGLHFHVSMWSGEGEAAANLFAPDAAQAGSSLPLSTLGRHFLAGVLAHGPALCALAAPTVNSYKRLRVGRSITGTSWAPARFSHGPNNRTALLRTLPGRFEWRLPDASANPYLASAGLIAAGLDGIDRGLDPGPACTADLFDLSPQALAERGLAPVPADLSQALEALARDEVILGALGPTLATQFLHLKRQEADEFHGHVTDWELARYAAAF